MSYERTWVGMKAIAKQAGPAPCKGCLKRHPGCHSACKEGYPEWKASLRQQQMAYEAAVKPGKDAASVRYDAKEYSIQKNGHRVNQTQNGGITKGRRR